jgi:ribosome-associated protein
MTAHDPHDRSSDLTSPDVTDARELALCAAGAAADKKATGIRILFLGDLLGITDFFVVVSAANERQLGTVAEEVERAVKATTGRGPLRREGVKETGWMLLDFGEVVVHAFTAEQREFYNLERLWSDAPTVPFDDLTPAASSGE